MEQRNVAVVQKIYEDFGRGDIQAVVDAFAEDAVFKQPVAGESPLAGTYRGKEEIDAWFHNIENLTETEAFEPREFIRQGDRVVVFGEYRFLAKATQKSWQSEWVMSWTFRGGKVVDFQFYGDTAAEAAAFSQEG